MPCFKDAPPTDIGKDLIDLSRDPDILRSGVVRVRGLERISKRLWKKRQVTLVENALLIQHAEPYTLSQHSLKRIPLKSIINIERVDLTPACLLLEFTNGKKCYLSFENDAVLYDWQDDIYPRSRLGNFSHPFNLVHEVHLTTNDLNRNTNRLTALRNRMQPPRRKSSLVTNHRTSSELSHQQTHRQSLSPQRASYDSYAKTAKSHKRTNSASSTSTFPFVFDSSIHPTGNLTASSPSVLLEGLYQVKRWGRHTLYLQISVISPHFLLYFPARPSKNVRTPHIKWRPSTHRYRDDAIHQSSHPEVTIQLPHISDVSQLKLKSKPFVLRLATCDNRRYHISLPNTSDLQRWCHFIASRSRRAHISEPEGFEFHVHVSWDSKSQAFTGLPDEWKTSLEVQQIQEKAREPSSNTSSPVMAGVQDSPVKPIGPSCPMCYSNLQCNACKLDTSFVSSSTYNPPRLSRRSISRRNRPFSIQSGTTLIGDHENHRY
ncbi:hypothetical protein D9756_004404 [Leucocoprinus leucothites]|uniref:PH domain-containing protein n=1 Tax=Leucocoprinus leucothites TaxID=201217 RepID=A0A8H5G125_9AGAR|nr:hypothetical protein D9756_004404 [Leucoagaricus leucothites]